MSPRTAGTCNPNADATRFYFRTILNWASQPLAASGWARPLFLWQTEDAVQRLAHLSTLRGLRLVWDEPSRRNPFLADPGLLILKLLLKIRFNGSREECYTLYSSIEGLSERAKPKLNTHAKAEASCRESRPRRFNPQLPPNVLWQLSKEGRQGCSKIQRTDGLENMVPAS